jgi:hypothetical protein
MDSEIKDIINRLEQQGKAIDKAISALRELEGQPVSAPVSDPAKTNAPVQRGTISDAGRRRLAAAMKARWAVKKKAGNAQRRKAA